MSDFFYSKTKTETQCYIKCPSRVTHIWYMQTDSIIVCCCFFCCCCLKKKKLKTQLQEITQSFDPTFKSHSKNTSANNASVHYNLSFKPFITKKRKKEIRQMR